VASRTGRRRRKNRAHFAVLDIGASKAACVIARIGREQGLEPQAEIVGVGYQGASVQANMALSPARLEATVRRAVDAAERMAGLRIHEACVAAPGRVLRTRRIGVDIEVAGGVVTQEDVDDCLSEGLSMVAPPDCAPLHGHAIGYRLDGEEYYDDPVGLHGTVLSTEMMGVAARQSALDNLEALVENCGLCIDEFVAAPYAVGEGVLFDDEKDLGVVLIDIGAGSTDYAVYDDGVMIDCGGVGVGGAHITKDIAQIFGAPIAQAERIKTLHGAALIGPGDEHRFVDFPQLGVAGEASRASRADLCEVIMSRMEEIFELVAKRLPDHGAPRSNLTRAVITGGGGLLVGAREVAEKTLAMKARIGRPLEIAGAPESATGQNFAVCMGLVRARMNAEPALKSGLGAGSQSLHSSTQAFMTRGVAQWLRERF